MRVAGSNTISIGGSFPYSLRSTSRYSVGLWTEFTSPVSGSSSCLNHTPASDPATLDATPAECETSTWCSDPRLLRFVDLRTRCACGLHPGRDHPRVLCEVSNCSPLCGLQARSANAGIGLDEPACTRCLHLPWRSRRRLRFAKVLRE